MLLHPGMPPDTMGPAVPTVTPATLVACGAVVSSTCCKSEDPGSTPASRNVDFI